MNAHSWALGFVCSLVGLNAGIVTACSAKPNQSTHDAGLDDLEDADNDANTRSTKPTNQDGSNTAKTNAADAGSGNTMTDAGATKSATDASGITAPSHCSLAADDPDDDFADTNCDGIDGDKSKAVFVATTGNDAADGSWGKPVATLGKAIALAMGGNKDVYACAGEYNESIAIDSVGLRVYGGYDCAHNWTRSSKLRTHLASRGESALRITNTAKPVVFDFVDISSAGASLGMSSVAVFISKSTQVTLRQGTYAAGSGGNAEQATAKTEASNSINNCFAYVFATGRCYGEPGTNATQSTDCFLNSQSTSPYYMTAAKVASLAGQLATFSDYSATNTCKGGGTSYGGKGGGTNTNNPQQGSNGTAGLPASTSGTLDGKDGAPGKEGSAAAQVHGTLTDVGYVASNTGAAGESGHIGEAGVGGNGGGMGIVFSGGGGDFPYYLYAPRAGGGKGGFGGCPGDGGAGGDAGGASIAVASYQSQVALQHVTLTTSRGGNGAAGGLGGEGAIGQPGGASGTAHYTCSKCPAEEATACTSVVMTNSATAQAGGKGGKGGAGGRGGPGGGGPSIPLFVAGAAPTLSAATLVPAAGGLGGNSGAAHAADGESIDQLILPATSP